ncbi:MAG: chromate efflux transporter [Actinomycetota bacterium]|nr:chromate efflux transporter [Actinomycetota bacterium]MDH5224508.1 chromate efflux transporter [Actinomycetota bacterium]
MSTAEPRPHDVSFREASRFWIKLGFINFGGPAGQIALMHDEVVDRRRWVSNGRFLHALNYCMLLPGPEAQQLAIYLGWLLHRVKGGLVAGIMFVLPSVFVMFGLSWLFAAHGDVTWVGAIFAGLAPAVIAIVAAATIRIGTKALANGLMLAVAIAAFLAIFVVHVPFPLIVLGAVAIGAVGGIARPDLFDVGVAHELEEQERIAIRDDAPRAAHTVPSRARAARTLVIGVIVWLAPIVLIAAWRGGGDTLTEMGWFFSRASLVTFGGAYAVLAYVNVAAVQTYGWLLPGQMVVGLGLAESTPGPLIMVLEFVGFVGAYQNPGELDPLVAGSLGAFVAVWATFAPCFLWIFLGAPYIESLRGNRRLAAALQTVTAAVVGVIANLAVTFAIATLFDEVGTARLLARFDVPSPVWSSVDGFAAAVAIVAFIGLWRFRWKALPVIAVSALAGLVWYGLLGR